MIYILSFIAFLILAALILYNSLIRKKNDSENAFASIDVMLKRRYDLIPALVDIVEDLNLNTRIWTKGCLES